MSVQSHPVSQRPAHRVLSAAQFILYTMYQELLANPQGPLDFQSFKWAVYECVMAFYQEKHHGEPNYAANEVLDELDWLMLKSSHDVPTFDIPIIMSYLQKWESLL